MNDRHGRPGKGLWAFSLVTLAFLFVAFSLPLLGEEVVNVPRVALTPADVTESGAELDGDDVVVSGIVRRVLGPRLFLVGGPPFGDRPLLVALKTAERYDLQHVRVRRGDLVQVTGEVESSGTEEFDNEVGKVLGAGREYADRPALMAEQIAVQSAQGRRSAAQSALLSSLGRGRHRADVDGRR